MLVARYGVRAEHVLRVTDDVEMDRAVVRLATGGRVYVTRYLGSADIPAIRARLEFTAHCYDIGIPTTSLWRDTDGAHLTLHGQAAWYVTDPPAGLPGRAPLNTAQAESVGLTLGRLHRTASGYPGPLPPAPAMWQHGDVTVSAVRYEALLDTLMYTAGELAALRHEQLSQRLNDLLASARKLRGALPPVLTHAHLHGAATRNRILMDRNTVTALTELRAVTGAAAWELALAAFDPLTIARADTWPDTAATMIAAYQQANPGLPSRELVATPRIALIHHLYNGFGTGEDDGHPTGTPALMNRACDDEHQTVALLLEHLGDIEDLLESLTTTRPKAATR